MLRGGHNVRSIVQTVHLLYLLKETVSCLERGCVGGTTIMKRLSKSNSVLNIDPRLAVLSLIQLNRLLLVGSSRISPRASIGNLNLIHQFMLDKVT